jgi:Flp pilus assembly CpaF family ATPase
MSVDPLHHGGLDPTEHRRYRAQLVAAIEHARAELAERVAAANPGRRVVLPDEFEDRSTAGEAVGVELAAIARARLGNGLAVLPARIEEVLKSEALDHALGLGPMQPYLTNPDVEELDINADGHAFAWWGDGTKTYEGRLFDSDEAMIRHAQRVGRDHGRSGQRLDPKHPFLRVDLPGGHRYVAVLGGDGAGGVSTGAAIALRRKRLIAPTLDGLAGGGMFPHRLGDQFRITVRGGVGMIVAGPMFSGKTTLLTAKIHERNPEERVATFERDVLELGLRDRWNGDGVPPDVIEFYTRTANTEGEGAIEMDELNSRVRQLRVDRLLLGEIVHGPDAYEMLIASSGATYRSMATLHADDPTIVLGRLARYCAGHPHKPQLWEINAAIAETIDLIVFCELIQHGDRRYRRVTSVREVGHVNDHGVIASSEIWGYDPDTDTLTQHQAYSPNLLDRLRRRGLTVDAMLPIGVRS